MRYIRVDDLKEGMINYKPLYGKNNEILLNSGAIIRETYIPRIKELGYYVICIEDPLSEEIIPTPLIDDNLRLECVKTIRNIYTKLSSKRLLGIEVIDNLNNYVEDIIDSIMSNKDLMVNIIDLKGYDDYTYAHSVNVAVLSIALGIRLNCNRNVLNKLGMAALLHDIGKMFIPKEIINKNSRLTKDEFMLVKKHPLTGYELLKDNGNFSHYSCVGILHHHERFNGEGYPLGISGKDISLLARIIMICDVYDALISDRPYRKALFPSEVIEYVMGGSGSLFDPDIVQSFVKIIAPYPVGIGVKLSNNKSGIVVKNYPDVCMRPLVKVLFHGDHSVAPYLIDLKNDPTTRDIIITGIADF